MYRQLTIVQQVSPSLAARAPSLRVPMYLEAAAAAAVAIAVADGQLHEGDESKRRWHRALASGLHACEVAVLPHSTALWPSLAQNRNLKEARGVPEKGKRHFVFYTLVEVGSFFFLNTSRGGRGTPQVVGFAML